jgi:MinD superfamily P-loop ATPase
MKQIVFISGKGGTGKSTIVASLSQLVNNKMVSDCDVETPNLHIILNHNLIEENRYFGTKEAIIDDKKCLKCGICRETCLFKAIDSNYKIVPFKCEGCGACMIVCSHDAIKLLDIHSGNTYVSNTKEGIFSYALLNIGAEGSGKLVTEVKKIVKKYQSTEDYIIVDGSPGIGCVVVASITGADAVVVVTEPTLSGISDLKRILEVVDHFNIKSFICINKYDINIEKTTEIEKFCLDNNRKIIGKIPFEPKIVTALREFKTPVDYELQNIIEEIRRIWNSLNDEN